MRTHEDVTAKFAKDTADHQLTILHDDGFYRHLRVSTPGTNCYAYSIATWPGHLAITGDMGAAVFSRLPDMFEFFRDSAHNGNPNVGYWTEKMVATENPAKQYCRESAMASIAQFVDDFIAGYADDDDVDPEWAQALRDVVKGARLASDEDGQRGMTETYDAVSGFEASKDLVEAMGGIKFEFTDVSEMAPAWEEYTFHHLWRLRAILHAVTLYDKAKSATG